MVTTKTVEIEVLRARIQAMFEAFNDHDVDKILGFHARDAVWVDPASPEAIVGKPAIRNRLVEMFTTFPDLHFPVEDIEVIVAEDGAKAVAMWTVMATMTGPMMGFAPTGKEGRFSGVCVYEFRGEQITRHTVVYDSMALGQMLGLLPSMTGVPMRVITGAQRVATRVVKLVPRR